MKETERGKEREMGVKRFRHINTELREGEREGGGKRETDRQTDRQTDGQRKRETGTET